MQRNHGESREREIRRVHSTTHSLTHIPESLRFPERDMIEDTRRIVKITPTKYNAHLNVRAAGARVMQRSCFSTPTDPLPFLFFLEQSTRRHSMPKEHALRSHKFYF